MSSEKKEHIDGIYNYCDRWCEKCTFTAKCFLFTQESKIQTYEILHNGDMTGIDKMLQKELDLSEDENSDSGEDEIDFHENDFWESHEDEEEEFLDEDKEDPGKSENPLNNFIDEYFSKAHALIKIIDSKFGLLNRPKGKIQDPAALKIYDDFEIVLWYHTLIGPKLNRALFGLNTAEEENDEELREMNMYDINGSAKIGIISVKRSVEALNNLHNNLPEYSAEIEEAFILLGRILNLSDELFPGCMKFRRPGFDD